MTARRRDPRMRTEFISKNVWKELRAASRASRRPASVAVAYFSESASRMLRLPKGSRLVVDASDQALGSGQTSPAALLRLVRRGVRVFGVGNLHAKVYVFGRTAYVGSANCSKQSAHHLVEAIVATTAPTAVASARQFVRELCLQRLGPSELERLQAKYRPPRIPNGKVRRKVVRRRVVPQTAPLKIIRLNLTDWPESEAGEHKAGLRTAATRRKHREGWEVQEFRVAGRCALRRGDTVMQIVDEGGGRRVVEPPGMTLHIRHLRTARGQAHYVYVEVRRVARRPSLKQLLNALGKGANKRIARDGVVRHLGVARRIREYWER
jgi:hypothetical protein